MKAYLCLYVWLFYQNDVLAFGTSLGTFGPDKNGPLVLSMNGGNNMGTEEIVVPVQVKTNYQINKPSKPSFADNFIKPIWVKKKEQTHESNKPLITYNFDGYKGTETEGTNYGLSERSENDNGIVNNIGEARQPGNIFFKPYWTSQAKNALYQDNKGFNNQPGQNGIYIGSQGHQLGKIDQIGKGFKSQHWKPQNVVNKGLNNHPGYTLLSGTKGNKNSQNFQDVKSLYSLSRDTLNSNHLKGKKNVPLKHPFQSSTQNPGRTENQEIRLPNLLKSNSFEGGNANDADIPSEAKIRDLSSRHKRRTSINKKVIEGTPTGQILIWKPNSPNIGNYNPVSYNLNRIDLGDNSLNTDHRLEKNTLKSSTIIDKRIRAPKGHSWNQRDIKFSGNLIYPARNSLNPVVLAGKGSNTLFPKKNNTVNQGGRNTNHPDEQSNGNSGNDQNGDVERNIHYPDIAGMKNVHPKDLLQYLRGLKVLVEPTSFPLRTDAKTVPNATKDEVATPFLNWNDAAKWGGILFRSGSPKNGTRSRFMSFPLIRSNILRDDDDDDWPVQYKFHFGGILWWA